MDKQRITAIPPSSKCLWDSVLKHPRFMVDILGAVLFSLWLMYNGIKRSQELLDGGGARIYGLGLRYDKSWFDKTRPMDISDMQWSTLRDFLPILFILGAVFVIVRRVIDATLCRWMKSRTPTMVFYSLTSMAFSCAFMGSGAIFPLIFFVVNVIISRTFRNSKWNPIITWAINVAILVTSDYYDGYPFRKIIYWNPSLGSWLDSYRGLLPWQIYFKMILCRFISFNLDFYSHLNSPENFKTEEELMRERKRLLDVVDQQRHQFTTVQSEHSYRHRKFPRQTSDYSVINFFVFVFYLPLYIAGPLCSFNTFTSYITDRQQQQFSWRSILWNVFLVAVFAITLDVMLHYNYMHMFSERRLWRKDNMILERLGMGPMNSLDLMCMWFSVLTFMFMKFLILWRLFRFWAIADGINPPENMNRCIFNTSRVSQFWRAWHRSLHEWCVAYIYVPLGGSKRKITNSFLIFFFMAIWHDLWMRWIAWASLNIALTLVEMIAGLVMDTPYMRRIRDKRYFVVLSRTVLGFNSLMISMANMAIMYSFKDTWALITQFFTGPSAWWQVYIVCFSLIWLHGDFTITIREMEEKRGDKKPF